MKLSAGRTLYYSIVLLLSVGTAFAADDDFSAFKEPKDIPADISAAVDTFQKPAVDKDKYKEFPCKAEWDKLTPEDLGDIYAYLYEHAFDSPSPAKCK